MHKSPADSVTFVRELAPALQAYDGVGRVVCPTFLALVGVAEALKDTPVKVGAQNVHWEAQGAFTSQISPAMLQGLVEYVIIGHSECRAFLSDTD
jgi:triosephosphate isomerase